MSSMDRTAGSTSERTTDSGAGGFEEFFRAEHARLLRALYLVTGSVEEANEVAQDALVRVWSGGTASATWTIPPATCTGRR